MQYINIFQSIANNKSYLQALFTSRHLQIVESNIPVGEGTGYEQWRADVAMLFLFGEGKITVGKEIRDIRPGDLVCISPKTEYLLENMGSTELKVLLVFGSPVLKSDTNDGSKISEIFDNYKFRLPKGL